MAFRNPAIVAVLLLALLLIYDPNFASGATGGRAGGSLFSSSRSPSRSRSRSPSRSRSWSEDHWRHKTTSSSPSSSSSSSPSSSSSSDDGFFGFLILAAVICFALIYHCAGVGKTSVVKLQVGLVGKAQSLQRDLNRITETTDMSTSTGLSSVLTGATTSLLRNLDYCISSYSSVARKSEIEEAEQCFKQLSTEEAAKFGELTLANVNNFKLRSTSRSPNEVPKEYIVVTILVATRGAQKVPTINGTSDLKKALQNLGSIPSNKIVAVEVLWTPQQENDTLTEKELLKDYPNLRGFYEETFEEGPFEDQQPFLGANVV